MIKKTAGEGTAALGGGGPHWGDLLGLEILSSNPQEVILQWDVDSRHLQPWGVVHGGVHASVVETACSLGAQNSMPRGKHVVGVENHTSFVRAVGKGRLRATARPLHAGRRAQLWECEIVDEANKLIATGRLRLLCVDDVPAHDKVADSSVDTVTEAVVENAVDRHSEFPETESSS